LDECVVVYLDDIFIYSRDMKQHVEHLRRVFEILRRERFYVKLSKSEFTIEKVQFLGHMVSAQGVHVDPKKIKAVRTWKTPENVKELQQFLGFANYYNRFVPQYAKIAAPLTDLLKKNNALQMGAEAPGSRGAAEASTYVRTGTPFWPDPERDYVIEADASDQAVGVVLMQDQGNGLQPIAYLSKKLHGAELNYPIHDKEALAIIIGLQSMEMLSRRMKNDRLHRPLQPEIFEDTTQPFQAAGPVDRLPRDTLPLRHRVQARSKNKADALSRPAHKSDIFYIGTVTSRTGKDQRKSGYPITLLCASYYSEEYHDVLYAGHFGSNKRSPVSPNTNYWPHLAEDVQKFVTSCDTCQRMKSTKQKKAGLLQPLPVPEQPWQVVSLDFITGLPPTSSGHDAILVVIDKFSKMGHFIPTHTTARTEETAQLFVRYIISQHGIPTTLISDRDPKFTSKFWKELMSLLGTKLAMSSAYHPADRRTDRAPQPNC
ncbi:hypothetical protein CLOM_g10646, partial [Closterium sp. NIES-68]